MPPLQPIAYSPSLNATNNTTPFRSSINESILLSSVPRPRKPLKRFTGKRNLFRPNANRQINVEYASLGNSSTVKVKNNIHNYNNKGTTYKKKNIKTLVASPTKNKYNTYVPTNSINNNIINNNNNNNNVRVPSRPTTPVHKLTIEKPNYTRRQRH